MIHTSSLGGLILRGGFGPEGQVCVCLCVHACPSLSLPASVHVCVSLCVCVCTRARACSRVFMPACLMCSTFQFTNILSSGFAPGAIFVYSARFYLFSAQAPGWSN